METLLVAVVLMLIVAGAIAAFVFSSRRRTNALREQFGPEYEHTLAERGGRRPAEAELEARRKRVESLDIVPLSAADARGFGGRWQEVQSRFVDDPGGAITAADELVTELMQKRGYPVRDFEERAADISVDHSTVVTDYRAACSISEANSRGEADTDQLRQAMLHYRSLFSDLLETRGSVRDREVA
jgi:hypothetical protein